MSTTTDVWIVAHDGVDHYTVRGVYASYDKAVGAWNVVRLEIIAQCQEMLEDEDENGSESGKRTWQRQIDNLFDPNPETCHNYHDSPSLVKHQMVL